MFIVGKIKVLAIQNDPRTASILAFRPCSLPRDAMSYLLQADVWGNQTVKQMALLGEDLLHFVL